MTNREKYEKEILDVVCDRGLLAVDKHTNKVMLCKDCYEDRLRKESGALTDSPHHRLPLFNHMFQTIKWEDEEPCEFRKYIGEQNG